MQTESKRKIIVLTGGTGFVGSALTVSLLSRGYEVRILTRDKKKYETLTTLPVSYYSWDPMVEPAPAEALEGTYAIIHLAGEPVAGARWTSRRKKNILDSRVKGTQNLLKGIENLKEKPKNLVGTSAIGFFGDRKNEELKEDSAPGKEYLSDVCIQWEQETLKAQSLLNVSVIRVGIVLGTESGALAQMLPIFRFGLGGPLGDGNQWMSWIHIQDLVNLYIFALEKNISGIVNGVAPNPVSNKEFTRAISETLARPAFMPAPKFAIKLAFGEMSAIILSSQKVFPDQAKKLGFEFTFATIQSAMKDLLSPNDFKGSYVLQAYQWVQEPREKVFDFFSQASNLEVLTPEWLHFKIEKMSDPKIKKDTIIDYKLNVRGIPIRWKTLIEQWNPEFSFVDRMLKGPYRDWHHTHEFTNVGTGTLISDRVIYRLPFGVLGDLVALIWVRSDVRTIFEYRKRKITELFKR